MSLSKNAKVSITTVLFLILAVAGGAYWMKAHQKNLSNGHEISNNEKLVPLTDLGAKTYKGYEGGLYSNGSNQPPADYLQKGLDAAAKIQPLDLNGKADPNGKIVLLSVGMSNTTMEFSYFKRIADSDHQKNPKLLIVDGAQGGQDAEAIKNLNANYWSVSNNRIIHAGASNMQVQVVWLKEAIAGEKNAFPNDAINLQNDLKLIISNICQNYPNVRVIYLSSRIYAGYATSPLNPEPYAYESGFAVKWLIEQESPGYTADKPWLAWGAYLWSNDTEGRSDGLIWEPSDFSSSDGTHPSQSGVVKVANQLLQFFKTDVTAKKWFLRSSD